MTILIRRNEEQARVQLYAQALERWRSAERLVSERWRAFLGADCGSKAGAFAAYAIALRAEESAAGELALLHGAEAA
ncbi:MAG TPA: hypothetical protein VJT75_00315 [Thermoleophilaceae bacterium]|nr:hypothetical protein [Thermoleophilaceae bacterium]